MRDLYPVLVFSFLVFSLATSSAQSQDTRVFFSEYIEGSSNNKALEINNRTGSPVDLSSYLVTRYNNGSISATDSLKFPAGTILTAGDVYVIGNPNANATILAQADTTHSMTFFNGDDAIALIKRTTPVNSALNDTLDIIGEIGVDPGSCWTVGTGATANYTLVRKGAISRGNTDWSTSANEWDVYPIDDFSHLGSHKNYGSANLFFSEYIEGSSSNKSLEIFNGTDAAVHLPDYVVFRYNNGSLSPTDSLLFPDDLSIAQNDVYVIGNPGAEFWILSEADTTHSMTFFNGDDAIALIKRTSPINAALNDTLDIIGEIGVDPGSCWTVGTGATANYTLVRKGAMRRGNTDWSASVNEWDVYPIDEFSYLGWHDLTLPVELAHFEYKLVDEGVRLSWMTFSETNNAGFEIQQRRLEFSGSQKAVWEAIGFVAGCGTTIHEQSYTFRVVRPKHGPHVYRLRQVDHDGSSSYSKELEVLVPLPGQQAIVHTYPNPFRSEATTLITASSPQRIRVTLFDALGRPIKRISEFQATPNEDHRLTLESSHLPSGVYILSVEGDYFTSTQRIVHVR